MIALLSQEERQHSDALSELIRARIAAAGGWLSFDSFMELALYAPGLGYYSAGAVKLGAGGDFRDSARDVEAIRAVPRPTVRASACRDRGRGA